MFVCGVLFVGKSSVVFVVCVTTPDFCADSPSSGLGLKTSTASGETERISQMLLAMSCVMPRRGVNLFCSGAIAVIVVLVVWEVRHRFVIFR